MWSERYYVYDRISRRRTFKGELVPAATSVCNSCVRLWIRACSIAAARQMRSSQHMQQTDSSPKDLPHAQQIRLPEAGTHANVEHRACR